MPEANNGSVDAGSPLQTNVDPNKLGDAGQSTKNTSTETVPKSMYAELEKKLGEMSGEVGTNREAIKKYEEWFEDTKPLWEKLEASPELAKAIIEGKIDATLAQAVIEGNVSIKEAKEVTKAHDQVKEDLGKSGYQNSSPEEINKLIEAKVKEATSTVEEKVKKTFEEQNMSREYEEKVKDFVRNTADYADYAADINKYFELHPKLDDIEVAYQAVKGVRLQAEKDKAMEKDKAEAAKGFATNVSNGGNRSASIITESDEVSKYIGKSANANRF